MTFPVPSLSYITTRFGSGHRGIDLCAPNGTPILAADSGTVIEAGYHWSFGNYLLIDHGNGITTRYAHCSALLVGAGSTVTRGQQIATIGISGVATGYHCHFEVGQSLSNRQPEPGKGDCTEAGAASATQTLRSSTWPTCSGKIPSCCYP